MPPETGIEPPRQERQADAEGFRPDPSLCLGDLVVNSYLGSWDARSATGREARVRHLLDSQAGRGILSCWLPGVL